MIDLDAIHEQLDEWEAQAQEPTPSDWEVYAADLLDAVGWIREVVDRVEGKCYCSSVAGRCTYCEIAGGLIDVGT